MSSVNRGPKKVDWKVQDEEAREIFEPLVDGYRVHCRLQKHPMGQFQIEFLDRRVQILILTAGLDSALYRVSLKKMIENAIKSAIKLPKDQLIGREGDDNIALELFLKKYSKELILTPVVLMLAKRGLSDDNTASWQFPTDYVPWSQV
jgi:hypothetical protein